MITSVNPGDVVTFSHFSKEEKLAKLITGTLWFINRGEACVIDSSGILYVIKTNLIYSFQGE